MPTPISEVPFTPDDALNFQRLVPPEKPQESRTGSATSSHSARENQGLIAHVPGESTVSLIPARVQEFLLEELSTPLLDELYPKLWLVSKKSGRNIDSLHFQIVKNRTIVPAEDPRLHMTWTRGKIYLKPIPLCLLNYDFWTTFLVGESKPEEAIKEAISEGDSTAPVLRPVAIGFLRSYAFLIRHRLDFKLACEHHLIPDEINWDSWSKFIAHFRYVSDDCVSSRYHYGQLRLSRLHWVVRLFPGRSKFAWFYNVPHFSIPLYLESVITPLIFVFASISVILSSMQVLLSVPADIFGAASMSDVAKKVSWVFSVCTLIVSGILWILFLTIPCIVLGWQLLWGYEHRK